MLVIPRISLSFFFFFNDTATTEIYTLSLHDALPIYQLLRCLLERPGRILSREFLLDSIWRSEEHTSELQSRLHLVCRLLLEKKKNNAPDTLASTVMHADPLDRPRVSKRMLPTAIHRR